MNPVGIVGFRPSPCRFSGLTCLVLLGCNELLGIQPGELAESGGSAQGSNAARGGNATGNTSGQNTNAVLGGSGNTTSGTFGAGGRVGLGGAAPTAGVTGLGGVPKSTSSGLYSGGSSSTGGASAGGSGASSSGGTTSSTSGGSMVGGAASAGGATSAGGTSSGTTTPCVACDGREIRMFGTHTTTSNVIGNMAVSRSFVDVCPDGQVLVGAVIRTVSNPLVEAPNFEGIGAICAPLDLDGTAVETGQDHVLPMRGIDGATTAIRCPDGEVVSELWGGAQSSPISPTFLGVRCVKLGLTRADREARVGVATTGNSDYFGEYTPDGTTSRDACQSGQVADGLFIRANGFVDAVGLTCATPLLAYPEGASCQLDSECLSGNCDQTCKPMRCPPNLAGCTCGVYLEIPYMFCRSGRIRENAEYTCSQFGMYLAWLDSPYEHGWLSTVMATQKISRFWVGARYDEGHTPPAWRWDAGGFVPPPLEADPFSFWANAAAADPAGGKPCLVMDRGNFAASSCDVELPFACRLK